MNRTKSLVMGLLLVAVVVALEEWRLAGLRSRIVQLGKDLVAAEAAIPPPPRPEPPGEEPGKLLRRTQTSQAGEEKPGNATAAAAAPEDAAPAKTDATPEPALEPVAATESAVAPKPLSSQVRSTANQSLRNSIVKLYANLIDKFQFNNVEAGYFVDLLVEDALNRQQLATDLGNARTDAEGSEFQRRAEQTGADIARRMRTFLDNDNDFGVFREYRRFIEQPAEKAQ